MTLELPRPGDPLGLEVIREFPRVRLEIRLPALPLLDELEASRVRAHPDAHALDGVRDVLSRSFWIPAPHEVIRRGGQVVRVAEEFEQGLSRSRVAPGLVQGRTHTSELPARTEERVEPPQVPLDVRPQFRSVRIRPMPQHVVQGLFVRRESFVQGLESGHRSPRPAMALSGEKPSRLVEDLEPRDVGRGPQEAHEAKEGPRRGGVRAERRLHPVEVDLGTPLAVYQEARPVDRGGEVPSCAPAGLRDERRVLPQQRNPLLLRPRLERELLDPHEHASGFRGAHLSIVER